MSSVPDPVKIPENLDAKIWRYLTFAKLVSLLDSQSLFFSRADLLGDSFEFTYPKANYNAFNGTTQSENNEFFLWVSRTFAKQLFVSCWCMSEYESTAMWKQYLEGDEGVAIQTTYRRLRDTLHDCPYVNRLDIGMVSYVNYDLDRINDQNILQFIFHKRIQFAHEQELRAVIWLPTTDALCMMYDTETEKETKNADAPAGIRVSVGLDKLIEKIYVSPKAPSWFGGLVESIIKRYGIDCSVTQSSLADSPLK